MKLQRVDIMALSLRQYGVIKPRAFDKDVAMINNRKTRRYFTCLRVLCLLCVCIRVGPAAAGTPPGPGLEDPPVQDRYSQSPRLQVYSRAGARYESRVSGTVTDEEDPVDDEVAIGQSVDINSASAEELAAALPGIGPSKAQGIVEWRELHGPFRTVEQLLEVSGIGPRTLEKIRPYVRLGEALSMQRQPSMLPPHEAEVVVALSAIIQRAEGDRRQALSLVGDAGE